MFLVGVAVTLLGSFVIARACNARYDALAGIILIIVGSMCAVGS